MRRLLGILTLLLALVPLAGCGDDEADPSGTPVATDQAGPDEVPTGPDSGDPVPPGEPQPEVLELLHDTAVGGEVTEVLQPVTTDADLDQFVAQFSREPFGGQVRDAVREARTAYDEVFAAVIAIGCDVPPAAMAFADGDRYTIVPATSTEKPTPECFAPVTTVAVVGVSAG